MLYSKRNNQRNTVLHNNVCVPTCKIVKAFKLYASLKPGYQEKIYS